VDRSIDGIYSRALRFFSGDIWRRELRPGSIAGTGMRVLQFGVMVVEGFVRDQLLLRASALTYITILSVIPILAIVLNLLKALGITENLAEMAVNQIAAGLPETRERILALVQGADMGGLGTIGAVILVGTSVLSLRSLESTLNDIWGVRQSRGWARRFADYLAVMIVAPLLTAVALSLATSLRSASVMEWLDTVPALTVFYQFGLQRLPALLAAIAFTFLYWFFPNTHVKFGSAALGGVVAAILFFVAQYFYVEFSVSSARYSVLFGTFSQLPLLLFWLYLSWAVVLLGAEISFAHQNLDYYRREVQELPPGPAERESLGLRIALRVALAFRDRSPAPAASDLSHDVDISVRTVHDLVERLTDAGILAETGASDGESVFQLGRPAEDVKVGDVLEAIRGERRIPDRVASDHAPGADPCDRAVDELLGAFERVIGPVARENSLADLLAEVPRRPTGGGSAPDNG
jgi:membrane protein